MSYDPSVPAHVLTPNLTGVLIKRPDGVRIVRVASVADSLPYRASFAGAYQTIFAEPPYNERFYPSEAEAVLRTHLETPDNVTLLAIRGETQVVGFGLAVPASSRADVTRELRGLLPVRRTMYLSELGVLTRYRGSGLGRQLVQARLSLIDKDRFDHVVLRTSANRDGAYAMYVALGFVDMGAYMEVASRRNDGTVTSDRRLFLTRHFEGVDESEAEEAYDEDVTDSETWVPEV